MMAAYALVDQKAPLSDIQQGVLRLLLTGFKETSLSEISQEEFSKEWAYLVKDVLEKLPVYIAISDFDQMAQRGRAYREESTGFGARLAKYKHAVTVMVVDPALEKIRTLAAAIFRDFGKEISLFPAARD